MLVGLSELGSCNRPLVEGLSNCTQEKHETFLKVRYISKQGKRERARERERERVINNIYIYIYTNCWLHYLVMYRSGLCLRAAQK